MRNADHVFVAKGHKALIKYLGGYSWLNRRWSDVAKGVLKDDLKRLVPWRKRSYSWGKPLGVLPVDFVWQEEGSHTRTSSLEPVQP